jgi:DNA primase catalytic core
MARIKDTSVEAVRAAADIVAVIEDRTSLRKQGARLVGRCPFHEERTPSFSVNPSEGFFYCFGCHKGGDLITFVQETQGLDFVGAIEWLAERFRVTLEYEDVSPEQTAKRDRRARLLEVLDQAATYYERTLWETEVGSYARDYLKGRGLSEEIARTFRLGLSLGGDALTRKARAKGFTRDELAAAGLTRSNGNDYFPRRLMFPLADARGRVIGFQARKLHDDDPLPGKYVNTQESELFHKSAVVYGLDKARSAIAKQDRACVVEGNTDVIALRQSGFEPVVACMGTALTEQQLRELGRLTKPRGSRRPFAAWSWRSRRASTSTLSRCRSASIPPTIPRASNRGSPAPSRTSCTAFASSSTVPTTARRASVGRRGSSTATPTAPTSSLRSDSSPTAWVRRFSSSRPRCPACGRQPATPVCSTQVTASSRARSRA